MAQLKLQTVRGSTLVEVIVAMVVIMVVFVLATGIYTGIVRTSPSFRQQQIRVKTENVIAQSAAEGNFEDEVLVTDSLELHKTVVAYEQDTSLLLVTVKAVERGKEIGLSRRIVKK